MFVDGFYFFVVMKARGLKIRTNLVSDKRKANRKERLDKPDSEVLKTINTARKAVDEAINEQKLLVTNRTYLS